MLNEVSLAQPIAWSAEPGLIPRVPNGPDRGKSWDPSSVSALTEHASSRHADLRFSAQTEMRRRQLPSTGELEPAQRPLL